MSRAAKPSLIAASSWASVTRDCGRATPRRSASAAVRAEAFGIESHRVDGQDVMAVNDLTRKLVERARKGEGPFFMELMTYRYHGHHVGDINRDYYRSQDEEKDWKENKDPIIRFRGYLVSEGIATE